MLEKKNNSIKWTYQLDLYKNPTMAKNLSSLTAFICLLMFSLSLVIESGVYGANLETFFSVLKTQLIFAIGLFVLAIFCYLLYCKYMMGIYVVSYKMDNNAIESIKEKQPVNKTKLISLILTILGMNNKKGLPTNANDNLCSNFKEIKKIIEKRSQDLIILKSRGKNNQIFVKQEDYDEILAFIREKTKR